MAHGILTPFLVVIRRDGVAGATGACLCTGRGGILAGVVRRVSGRKRNASRIVATFLGNATGERVEVSRRGGAIVRYRTLIFVRFVESDITFIVRDDLSGTVATLAGTLLGFSSLNINRALQWIAKPDRVVPGRRGARLSHSRRDDTAGQKKRQSKAFYMLHEYSLYNVHAPKRFSTQYGQEAYYLTSQKSQYLKA